jgi:hypothetical protein
MLDGDHRALVEAVLPVCSRYGLAVAGGYAVKAHGLVERPSEDIDFATGASAPVGEIVAELAAAYRVAGFTVQVLDADGRKGHWIGRLRSALTWPSRSRGPMMRGIKTRRGTSRRTSTFPTRSGTATSSILRIGCAWLASHRMLWLT